MLLHLACNERTLRLIWRVSQDFSGQWSAKVFNLQTAKNVAKLSKCIYSLFFTLSACWHIRNYEGMVWVVTVVLLFYSCSMHHFFPILRVPKDPQATPWEPTAWKDKVENLCFGVHSLEFLSSTGKPGGGKLWTLSSLQKELSCCDNKDFSWNKSRQVWSCCAVSSLCSQGRMSCAANAPSALQGKNCSQQAPSNPPKETSHTELSIIPQYLPREWEATRCKDVALARTPFPWLFLFFQKNEFIEGNKPVVKTSMPGTEHPCLLAKLGSLHILCLLCRVIPALSMKSQSLNRWGEVFLVRLSYMVTTQLRNAGIWDSSGKTLLKDLQGLLY